MLVSKTHTGSIAYLGETELIKQIKSWLGTTSPPSPNGIGDDCAVIHPTQKGQRLITTDAINYGYHFDDTIAAEDAGAKLIKRNLSDIAAMGGVPVSAVLALLCSPNLSIQWLKGFFLGIRKTCEHYMVSIVGGDISTLKATSFSAVLTLDGYATTPKLRSSSNIDDHIYITGALGGSRLGKHYQFEPRIPEGQWLANRPNCHAMMDVSDGLGKDLQALLPEKTAAHLHLDRIPLSDAAHKLAKTSGLEALEHAFCDGEDYELLFTMSSDTDTSVFEEKWGQNFPGTPLTCIGAIRSDSSNNFYLDAKTKAPLPWTQGFEHLKRVSCWASEL